jgi:myo-inositol-1(or 4)-monophosphatase
VRHSVLALAGTEAGRLQLEVGAGGDRTMELDRAAEAIVFAELDTVARRGEKFSVLSEEAGHRSYGSDYPLILVDPVDGSRNAKQGIPLFGFMMSVLDGPNVDNTLAGCVLNLVSGEAWTSIRGRGAWRGGVPLKVIAPQEGNRIPLLALESTPRALELARRLVERSNKIRILGSMALSIAHTATGGFDVFCAPMPVRVFDTTASLLLLGETGGVATDMEGNPIGALHCSLETRTTLLCAASPALHARAMNALAAND